MTWIFPKIFDVIVIGAGHAGCEAAFAAARMGAQTLLLSMNLDTIAKMSCNPAIGGTAKGQIVREIDALGGEMGKVIDRTGIQFRLLNRSKGPAVWAPRAQADRILYQFEMKRRLEEQENLEIKQATTTGLWVEGDRIRGVDCMEGVRFEGKTVILSAGTFMRGLIRMGDENFPGGRAGDKPASGLSKSLLDLGFTLDRLKTGTPPRVHARSLNLDLMEEQLSEEGVRFSYEHEAEQRPPQRSCYISYTSQATKEIIEKNLHLSPMYSGQMDGIVGPRYCPSIEDKIVRFNDKPRHQVFLEPEGLNTHEIYVNGISSSLPWWVQEEFVRTVVGMENAEILRPAYAIEYDYLTCGQIDYSLESRKVENLFLAGQVNGTTGYEEAAAQGLMAGINAVRKIKQETPVVLKRSDAYIGVLIDDLVTKPLTEPYRMFTSRAEYRLLLRQDNADLRLSPLGNELGLLGKERFAHFEQSRKRLEEQEKKLSKNFKVLNGKGVSLAQILCRPQTTYESLRHEYPEEVEDLGWENNQKLEFSIKFAGYIERQKKDIAQKAQLENYPVPSPFDFSVVSGLRTEAQEKLSRVHPKTLGQASRVDGVSPADISVLWVYLKGKNKVK